LDILHSAFFYIFAPDNIILLFLQSHKIQIMKKVPFLIPILASIVLLFFASQCKKDTICKVRIICNYSENGIDTGDLVKNCFVEIGKDNYADFAQDTGRTNALGVYETEFQYEALLDVSATSIVIDTNMNETDYLGSGQVKLIPGETVEKVILLMPQ
jgi:hypothetical protein